MQLDMARRGHLTTQRRPILSSPSRRPSMIRVAAEEPRKLSVSLSRSSSVSSVTMQRQQVLVSPKRGRDVNGGIAEVTHVLASRSVSPCVRSESGPNHMRMGRRSSRGPGPGVHRVLSGPPAMKTAESAMESPGVQRILSGPPAINSAIPTENAMERLGRRASLPVELLQQQEEKVEIRVALPLDVSQQMEETVEIRLARSSSPYLRRRESLPIPSLPKLHHMLGAPDALSSISLHTAKHHETDVSLSPPVAAASKVEDDGIESTISEFSMESESLCSFGSSQSAHHNMASQPVQAGPIEDTPVACPTFGVDLEQLITNVPHSDLDGTLHLDEVAANLRDALRKARFAGLASGDEFVLQAERALMLLSQRDARAANRDQLARLSADFKKQCFRMADLDTMQQWKQRIHDALTAARASNLPETEMKEAELCRRKLHNRIEDIKGQVRVFCRLRPRSCAEESCDDPVIVHTLDDVTVALDGQEKLSFHSVFNPGTQEQVFEECCDLVQSAFDGFNVTIFTYGQTGAGKTHTMYGTRCDEGISGRAISEMFHLAETNAAWQETRISASMVELYNNDVLDVGSLVSRNPRSIHCKSSASIGVRGNGDLVGLAQLPVGSPEELKDLLGIGLEHRTVAAHTLNSKSSRSHFIFVINVVTKNRETGERQAGKLVLCDLGGSERLKRTEPEGSRRKEAIEINKSLTALGSVIEAVARKQKQIPYRNHKLTQMLQDSIGGTAKTLMIVNCSPTLSNAAETSMTLKFASKLRHVTNVVGCTKRGDMCGNPIRKCA